MSTSELAMLLGSIRRWGCTVDRVFKGYAFMWLDRDLALKQ